METLFVVIAVLGGVLSFASYVILAVVGFKQSVVWGLVNLLVPFGSVVFGIKYWAQAKVGCLMMIAAMALGIGSAAMIGGVAGMNSYRELNALQEQMEAQQATEQAVNGARAAEESAAAALPEPQPAAAAQPEPEPTQAQARQFAYRETDVDFLPGQIGKPVQIVTKDGREHAGILVAVEDDIIRIEKRMRGGSMEFFLRQPEVRSVKVLEEVQ